MRKTPQQKWNDSIIKFRKKCQQIIKISKKKVDLFNELDSYLMETYQTTSILIDDARLVTGEEGCLCTFDLEHIKNKNKEGLFDSKKIPQIVKQKIIERLDQIEKILRL